MSDGRRGQLRGQLRIRLRSQLRSRRGAASPAPAAGAAGLAPCQPGSPPSARLAACAALPGRLLVGKAWGRRARSFSFLPPRDGGRSRGCAVIWFCVRSCSGQPHRAAQGRQRGPKLSCVVVTEICDGDERSLPLDAAWDRFSGKNPTWKGNKKKLSS